MCPAPACVCFGALKILKCSSVLFLSFCYQQRSLLVWHHWKNDTRFMATSCQFGLFVKYIKTYIVLANNWQNKNYRKKAPIINWINSTEFPPSFKSYCVTTWEVETVPRGPGAQDLRTKKGKPSGRAALPALTEKKWQNSNKCAKQQAWTFK